METLEPDCGNERKIQQLFCLVWAGIVLDLFLAVQATLCIGASVTVPPDGGAAMPELNR